MLDKVPEALEHNAVIVTGMASFDSEYLENSDTVMNKLVDLHRKVKGPTNNKYGGGAHTSPGASLETDHAGTSAFKFADNCHTCGMKGHLSKDCKHRCKYCGLKCCGGVKGVAKCMVKNGIPPNAKLPTFVTDKIEKQAKEMKKKRGAMIVMGEESGDESDESDASADGHAFVASCIVINEDGVAYLEDFDGEEGDDEDDNDETYHAGDFNSCQNVIIVSKPLQSAFSLDVEHCSLDGT